jgi:hypothetical protein
MKDRLEIANLFFQDSVDFLARYRLIVESFSVSKSRRVKLFIDLRMAYECILKAHVAYYNNTEIDSRELLIRKVESFRHNVVSLFEELVPHIAKDLVQIGQRFNSQLALLPVSLRYSLDVSDFVDARETYYYSTVGKDGWLEEFAEFVKKLTLSLNMNLQAHSKIISGSELWRSLNEESHNKYLR